MTEVQAVSFWPLIIRLSFNFTFVIRIACRRSSSPVRPPGMTHCTWFQSELFILQSWMHLLETERAPFRHRQSASITTPTVAYARYVWASFNIVSMPVCPRWWGWSLLKFVLPPSSFTFTRCHPSKTTTSAFQVTSSSLSKLSHHYNLRLFINVHKDVPIRHQNVTCSCSNLTSSTTSCTRSD